MKPSYALIALIGLAATAAVTPSAKAVLIAYENFNTTAGTNNIAGSSGTGSSGFSNNWTTVTSSDSIGGNIINPGYTYSDIQTAGNRAQVFNAAATPDGSATFFYRNLSNPFEVAPASTGTVWLSFMIQGTSATGSLASIGLYSTVDPTLNTEGVQIGTVGSNSNYRVASRTMSLGGSGGVVTSSTVASELSFMVLKYTINTAGAESLSLWINPTNFDGTEGSLGSVAASSSDFGNPGYTGVRSIGFGSSFVNTGSATLGVDEIRIGTTLASVTPIPEPSALALIGVAVFGFAALRRHRKS